MIRHRLLAAIVTATAAVLFVTGVVVVKVLEDRLVAAVDDQLTEFATQRPQHAFRQAEHDVPAAAFDDRHMAILQLGPDGTVRTAIPAGPTDTPDPLPDVGGSDIGLQPRTVASTGGDGPDYRAIAMPLPEGGTVIAAVPLSDVHNTVATTRRILLAAGVAALAVVAALVWGSIRRGLRPIDDMIAAAERIAAGDLTARTSVPALSTEVGHLSRALNTMLDRIEHAMTAKDASEARLRRFVADASHELRTPLTSIRGYAELHRQGATSPAEVARGMARIEREAQHMAILVDDLLVLARLDRARPLDTEPVDLADLVRRAVADASAADVDRRIEAQVPPSPIIVSADATRLRQILDNLLGNVRDHTDPGTTARVTLTRDDATATLVFTDDGPGMTPEEAMRAFDRFWQAEPTSDRPRPGTGLGLAIVQGLVTAHGGTVTMDTSPGCGTTLTIVLRASEDHGHLTQPARAYRR